MRMILTTTTNLPVNMIRVKYEGRLGNNMIQYVAARLFSDRHNIPLGAQPNTFENFGAFFQFPESTVSNFAVEQVLQKVDDSNFASLLNTTNIPRQHYHFNGYFQQREWLENNRTEILNLFQKPYALMDDDQVFVHYRIGDIANDWRMLPVQYYQKALDGMQINGGYIASDTIDHPNCKWLMDQYGLMPYNASPQTTIDFGSRSKNLVLSEGTFSWWMGFLNRGGNVVCNTRKRHWHGEINLSYWKTLSFEWIDGDWLDNTSVSSRSACSV